MVVGVAQDERHVHRYPGCVERGQIPLRLGPTFLFIGFGPGSALQAGRKRWRCTSCGLAYKTRGRFHKTATQRIAADRAGTLARRTELWVAFLMRCKRMRDTPRTMRTTIAAMMVIVRHRRATQHTHHTHTHTHTHTYAHMHSRKYKHDAAKQVWSLTCVLWRHRHRRRRSSRTSCTSPAAARAYARRT